MFLFWRSVYSDLLIINNHQRNANKNHNEISPPTCQNDYHQQITNGCWRGCGEKEILVHIGRNADWCSHYEKQCGRFLKKLKMEFPYNPGIPLLGIYLQKSKMLI